MFDASLRKDISDVALWAFGLALVTLVYGPELGSFTLSADEEIHSYQKDLWRVWASQGRWGLAFLTYVLPPMGALPFLPTALFCGGLATTALLLAPLVAQTRAQRFVFVGFFVASPIWLHIAEFNTFSWAMGISLVIVALAARLAATQRNLDILLSGLCAGLATAVYQANVVFYALVLTVLFVRNRAFWQCRDTKEPLVGSLLRPAIGLALAIAVYAGVNFIALALLNIELTYIGNYFRLTEFTSSPWAAIARTSETVEGMLLGTDPTFLNWGAAVLLLPWLGFIFGFTRLFDPSIDPLSRRLFGLMGLVLAIAITFSLVIFAAGYMPTRALTSVPFLMATLAVNAFRIPFAGWFRWSAFGFAILVSCWISAALFYADDLARTRDTLLALRVAERIETVGREKFGHQIPILFVGERHHDHTGPARQAGWFGHSFFELNRGDNSRIGMFLRLQGLGDLKTVNMKRLQGKRKLVHALPHWPKAGSVAVIDNVVVVKMGDLTPPQKHDIKR